MLLLISSFLVLLVFITGAISSLSSPSQLFGQPQVAPPQFFLTGQTGTSGSVPVQQLLIPVSTGIYEGHRNLHLHDILGRMALKH